MTTISTLFEVVAAKVYFVECHNIYSGLAKICDIWIAPPPPYYIYIYIYKKLN